MNIQPDKLIMLDHINTIKSTIKTISSRSNRYAAAADLSTINDAIENLENCLNSFGDTFQNAQNSKLDKIITLIENPSFPSLPTTNISNPTQEAKPNLKQEIIIHPQKIDGNDLNADGIFQIIKNQIHTKKTKAKIVKIKKNRTNVSVICENSSQANTLIEDLSTNETIKSKATSFKITKQDPTIVIKDIDNVYDDTNLIDDIIEYNPSIDNNKDNYKMLFNINKKQGTKDVVLRVSPTVFKSVEMNNFKLFIPGQLCYVAKKILTRQCQNCFIFGHKTKDCKKTPVCYICGENKISNDKTEHVCYKVQKCANCHFHNGKNPNNQKPTNHFPNRKGCSYFEFQTQKVENNTNYYG